MIFANIAMCAGAMLALLGADVPWRIFHSFGIGAIPNYEVDSFVVTVGLCILTGGAVAYSYERLRN